MPHALIVDDSRTARAVLKHMLSKESYEVEAVESAEQGLNYLREGSTDVIFMDHMMPGMDGFQAVKHLKTSESLRHIPIVMYTSKEGDVYRGQANALGATSILSKPATQAQLQQVLKEVAASMVSASRADARAGQKEVAAKVDSSAHSEVGAEDVGDKHVEPAIEAGTKKPEIKTPEVKTPEVKTPAPVEEVVVSPPDSTASEKNDQTLSTETLAVSDSNLEKPSRKSSALMPWLLIAGVLAAILVGAKYSELRRAHDVAVSANSALLQSVIEVANRAGRFEAGELGFSGERVDLLKAVLQAADTAGFTGTVLLRAHAGQFCMSQKPNGELYVADEQLAITECAAIGMNEMAAVRQTETMSSRFRELLEVHPLLHNKRLSVRVEGMGDAEPLIPYPDANEVRTAGDWNSAAQANNRVEFELLTSKQQ